MQGPAAYMPSKYDHSTGPGVNNRQPSFEDVPGDRVCPDDVGYQRGPGVQRVDEMLTGRRHSPAFFQRPAGGVLKRRYFALAEGCRKRALRFRGTPQRARFHRAFRVLTVFADFDKWPLEEGPRRRRRGRTGRGENG